MRAVQFHGKEDVRLNDIPTPDVSPGHVRIRPAFVGICGTDVHEYARGATLIPETPHALTGKSPPITMGHEISGVVDVIGPGVSELNVGDHVAIQPILSDNTCYACQLNRPNCCAQQGFYGLSTDGGLADFIVVEARNARKVSANVPLDVAALIEPLSVAWHAVKRSVKEGLTSAMVIGAGPIGLCVVQALKAHDVTTIIAVDTNSSRESAAIQAGANHFINPMEEDVAETALRICNNTGGVHIAYDAAGKQETLDQCVASLCVGGILVNIAIWGGSANIMPNTFALGEKVYMGSSVYTREDFDEVIDAVSSGLLDPNFLITSKIGLSQVVSHGVLKLLHDAGSEIKILVDLSQA